MSSLDLTIVIAAYNSETSLNASIESAFLAGAREVVVVDDGSTDHTSEVARLAGARVLYQRNSGAAKARQRGIACVATEYFGVLDSDDTLLAAGVAESMRLLRRDSRLAVVGGRVEGATRGGKMVLLPQRLHSVDTRALLQEGYSAWPPGAAIIRTKAWHDSNKISISALDPKFAEDFEMLIRLSLVGRITSHSLPSLKYALYGGKSSANALCAISCKEEIRIHYARELNIAIVAMGSCRKRAAAKMKICRAAKAGGNFLAVFTSLGLALFWRALSFGEPACRAGEQSETA